MAVARFKRVTKRYRQAILAICVALIALFGFSGLAKATLLVVGSYFILESFIADTKQVAIMYFLFGLFILLSYMI